MCFINEIDMHVPVYGGSASFSRDVLDCRLCSASVLLNLAAKSEMIVLCAARTSIRSEA